MKEQRTEQLAELVAHPVNEGQLKLVAAVAANREGVTFQAAASAEDIIPAMATDSVVSIMSMTKAVTGAAAMQLVEQGKLQLDAPAGKVCPYLGEVQVLTGFDDNGVPVLRKPKSPVTLRNLLTHSSGFVYDIWNPQFMAYMSQTDTPSIQTRLKKSLEVPLMFDPGERWEYGIGIDWVGQMIEAVTGETLGEYCRKNIFAPLNMNDTGFALTDDMAARAMPTYLRTPDGGLMAAPASEGDDEGEFEMGGGGLSSTMDDFIKFLRMILCDGELDGVRVLNAETVSLMAENSMGDLRVTELPGVVPEMSLAAEFFPGSPKSWGLTFQINEQDENTGRKAGTLMWAGLLNSYYWIDRVSGICGVWTTQVLPFADTPSLQAYYAFEKGVYDTLG